MTDTRLQYLREEDGCWIYSFGDLVLRTETLSTPRADRVIALGGAAGVLMDYAARHADDIRGARVLEPFCGCGPIALLAVQLGAGHVCALDVNPRALDFVRHNAARSGLDSSRLEPVLADVATWTPDEPYDWILANPPFVPTPAGIDGALHSAAGEDGNRLSCALLSRLDVLLRPGGQALLAVFQIEAAGVPLLARRCRELLPRRPVELTRAHQFPGVPFRDLAEGYRERLPHRRAQLDAWEARILKEHGPHLTVDTYVVHVSPEGSGGGVTLRDYDGTKYGEGLFKPRRSARSVAHENLPGSAGRDS